MNRSTQIGTDGDVAVAAQDDESTDGISRLSFLAAGASAGVGAAFLGPIGRTAAALASSGGGRLTKGDAAILRFLAAAEILEADLWQQYNEFGGIQDAQVPGGSGSAPYVSALEVLDGDMSQYIHDNTQDEMSHFTFINAYLKSRGAAPVDLDKFRNLPSSKATGAQQIGRLTNLTELTVNTNWWTKYRSSTANPDLGGTFPQAVPALAAGRFPAIPRSDADLEPADHIQAIVNTAGFHFCAVEQTGASLYPSLAQRVSDPEVLRVLLSIGPTEAMHFQTWHDKAGNAPALTDPTNGLVFPNLNAPPLGGEEFKTNLIMPEPTVFLRSNLPVASIVRPTNTSGSALAILNAVIAEELFRGQPKEFFTILRGLANAADAAKRK